MHVSTDSTRPKQSVSQSFRKGCAHYNVDPTIYNVDHCRIEHVAKRSSVLILGESARACALVAGRAIDVVTSVAPGNRTSGQQAELAYTDTREHSN